MILDQTHTSLRQVLVPGYSIKAHDKRCLGVPFEILPTEAICQNFDFFVRNFDKNQNLFRLKIVMKFGTQSRIQ